MVDNLAQSLLQFWMTMLIEIHLSLFLDFISWRSRLYYSSFEQVFLRNPQELCVHATFVILCYKTL